MAYDPTTAPGGWVSARARARAVVALFVILGCLAAAVLLMLLAVNRAIGLIGSAVALAAILMIRPYALHLIEDFGRWNDGAVAETEVGMTLNALRSEEWIVMHDVEQDGEGNIDHLVAGAHGVYLVETKLRRYRDEDLIKVKRQAAKLQKELGGWVVPVVCLHERERVRMRPKKVAVVSRGELLDWLRAQRNQPADLARLTAWADRL